MDSLDRRIRELYRAALRLPVEERSSFLERACGDNTSLRQAVEKLLAQEPEVNSGTDEAGERADTVLQSPPFTRAAPVFSPDQLLSDRFRILRFVDHGGMGEVYEAYDLELRECVALKTIRPEIAEDGRAMERFRREVHLARKVTHPNVCRLYDIFYHGSSAATLGQSEKPIAFLTMELLSGTTLAHTLSQQPMGTREALPLVAQMADALAAAHRAGVVHRDFKSSNVMLVPASGESDESRVVVTDFGLARSTEADPSFTRSISRGEIAGTPAFMAPEQLQGGEVTAATDIYALGVVMYQMVTGALPFSGHTPQSPALRRLQDERQLPRVRGVELDPTWEAVIMRCLAPNPADRFADVLDVVRALKVEVSPTRFRTPWAGPKKRLIAGVAVAILGVSIGSYAFYHFLIQPRRAPSLLEGISTSRPTLRPSVAVLGFKNLTGREEAAWLAPALAEMLTTELAAGEKLRAIPGENVARMKIELTLLDAESYALDTIQRIRDNLGADLLVFGSYLSQGDTSGRRIRFDLRVQDAVSGEMVARVAETGSEADFLDLVSRTGARVRQLLGVAELAPAETNVVRASLPSNPEAARFYTQGLLKLRLFEAREACDLLEKALDADPSFPLAHAALAKAWRQLGYYPRATAAAEKAFALSEGLSRADRLSVEARYREIEGDWERSVEIYETLFNFFPDNLDYGLRLAEAQASAGNGQEALRTVEALRRFPPPSGHDARIDLAECSAAVSMADFKRLRQAAASAVAKGQQQGARLLVARAHLDEGWALKNLGDLASARIAIERAVSIFEAAGDRNGVMDAKNGLALLFDQQGDVDRAQAIYEELLALGREIGNLESVAIALNNLSITLSDQGDLDGGRRMLEEAIQIDRELGDKRAEAIDNFNLAILINDIGDRETARARFQESLLIYREIGNRRGEGKTLLEMGRLLVDEGNLVAGRDTCVAALAIFREIGQESDAAEALLATGDLSLLTGDLNGARKRYEEAMEIKIRLGEEIFVALVKKALATLSVEEGQPQAAEALAHEAAALLGRKKRRSDEALALEVLARSYLARGQLRNAQGASDRATELARTSPLPRVRIAVAVTSARVQAHRGEVGLAIEQLESVMNEATNLDHVGLLLETRLALGEAELLLEPNEAARARLLELARDARAIGFDLIADKAAAATQS